jgi:hypothetical protein
VRVCVLVQFVVLTVPSTGYPVFSAGAAVQLSAAVGAWKAGAVVHPVAVIVACPVTVGISVSCVQVIVCTNGALSLPHASTYTQVLDCVFTQLTELIVDVVGYPVFNAGVAAQLSTAVGSTNAGAAVHPVSVILGVPVTVGFSVSVILNVVLHVLVHPLALFITSVSVYVPHVAPANTVTFCVAAPEEMVPDPLIVHVYVLIPAGPEYVFDDEGQTLSFPVIEQTGKGFTVTDTHAGVTFVQPAPVVAATQYWNVPATVGVVTTVCAAPLEGVRYVVGDH